VIKKHHPKSSQKKNQVNNFLELQLLQSGYDSVVGVDEVGRGSWAGPVVVGVFVYSLHSVIIPGVDDSKKLSSRKREELSTQLVKQSRYCTAHASVLEITQFNIVNAIRLAIMRACTSLSRYDLKRCIFLIDGYFKHGFDMEHQCIKKGDAKHYSIAAASIIAKTYRDALMKNYACEFPGYNFEHNAGYGTKQHLEAIRTFGVCPLHRTTYAPIKRFL